MTTEQRFWKKVSKTGYCWIWTGSQRRNGAYKRGNFRPGGTSEKITVARFSWFIHHGKIPKKMCVLHKCDNGLCVNPMHLFLGSKADNVHDMDRKGRRKTTLGYGGLKGLDNPSAKLTEKDVKNIRFLYANGNITQLKIAKQFGVCQWTISAIVRKEMWNHI